MTDNTPPPDEGSLYANIYSYLGLPFSRDLDDEQVDAVVRAR